MLLNWLNSTHPHHNSFPSQNQTDDYRVVGQILATNVKAGSSDVLPGQASFYESRTENSENGRSTTTTTLEGGIAEGGGGGASASSSEPGPQEVLRNQIRKIEEEIRQLSLEKGLEPEPSSESEEEAENLSPEQLSSPEKREQDHRG